MAVFSECTGAGRTNALILIVLPRIDDDLDSDTKNGLAIRNACAIEGACPSCGVTPTLHEDEEFSSVMHLVFAHEPECAALIDEAA